MYNVIMQYFKSFLSCSIRNLTLASLSLLCTIKFDVFPPFLQVLIPTVFQILFVMFNQKLDFSFSEPFMYNKI